jgi:hypothetical protein
VLLNPPHLTPEEFENLVTFVRTGLLDERAGARNLCELIPVTLPSGMQPALRGMSARHKMKVLKSRIFKTASPA